MFFALHDPLYAGPFHRLTRPERGAWWRLPVALVAGVAGFAAASFVGAAIVAGLGAALDLPYLILREKDFNAGLLLATNIGLALLIVVALVLTALVYQVRPGWVVSLQRRVRWRWLAKSMGMAAVVWLVFFLIVLTAALTSRSGPIGPGTVALLVVVVVTQPLQAAGEEYLFRGYLLQALGATRMPTWVCIGVSAAVFAAAHLQFAPPLFADRFLLGAVLAWLTLRTGGLEAGIAIHTMKNVSGLIPAALMGETKQVLEPAGASWIPVAVDVVLLSVVCWWMVRAFDRHR